MLWPWPAALPLLPWLWLLLLLRLLRLWLRCSMGWWSGMANFLPIRVTSCMKSLNLGGDR